MMTSRRLLWSALGAVALFLIIGGGWLWSLPPARSVPPPPPIAQDERDATLAALRPPKRQRPLIAIIGINDGTETTDYLIDRVNQLCAELHVPTRLSQVGVRPEQLDDLVKGSRGNSMNGSPRQLSDAELRAVLEECL